MRKQVISMLMIFLAVFVIAGYAISVPVPQDDHRRQNPSAPPKQQKDNHQKQQRKAGAQLPLVVAPLVEEDTIPDSLLHTRWKIQRTMPITLKDLKQNGMDLKRPDNLKQDVVYNDSLDR